MSESPAPYNGNEFIDAETVAIELLEAATGNAPANVLDNPYTGIAQAPFSVEAAAILMADIPDSDIEIRPDGLIYLPEIKYRRILNRAFGPGAWSLLPKEIMVGTGDDMMYYRGQLFVHGRFVSEAIGEQQYYASNDRMSYATAAESAKSNCLVRCCKDLGIAGDLWDPSFVRHWIAEYAVGVWCENIGSNPKDKGKKRIMWRKKSAPAIDMYPWKEDGPMLNGSNSQAGAKQQTARQLSESSAVATAGPVERTHNSRNDVAIISMRQAKRFRAIAAEFGWMLDQMGRFLQSQGYGDPESIRRTEYDRLCAALEDPEIRNSFKGSTNRNGAVRPTSQSVSDLHEPTIDDPPGVGDDSIAEIAAEPVSAPAGINKGPEYYKNAANAGWSRDDAKAMVYGEFRKDSANHLTGKEMTAALKLLKDPAMKAKYLDSEVAETAGEVSNA